MKKRILLVLLLIVSLLVRAQQITGKVYRINSDSTVAGASIYFGGSIKGTSSNAQGYFSLTMGETKLPLIVSCVGYYSATIADYDAEKPLAIYLKPKENLMREVFIGSDGMAWAEKMRIFKREFIGVSEYAMSCDIMNPNDIDLRYDKETETLTGFCNKAIIIKNKRLGYTISYYLDNFLRSNTHVIFAGNYQFKDDNLAEGSQRRRINNNREAVYLGSRMQFVRGLWNGHLFKMGYEMFNREYQNIPADSLVFIGKGNQKYIRLSYRLLIAYKSNYVQMTSLYSKEEESLIGQNGFYGTGLMWSGLMSRQRIGDMLPFEYELPQEKEKPKKK